MAKGGRPPTYSEEERDEIIAYVLVQVATGRFVSRVFREDETTDNGIKLPHQVTFWGWLLQDETGELDNKLAQARARGIEALLDETVDIADDGTNDYIEKSDGNGGTYEAVDRDHIQRSKLRIETRIKLAQMMKPKTYGPKLDVTSGGEKIDSAALAAANERARKYDLSEEAKSHGTEDD